MEIPEGWMDSREADTSAMQHMTWTVTVKNAPEGVMMPPRTTIHGMDDLLAFLRSGCEVSGYAPRGTELSEPDGDEVTVGVVKLDPMLPFVMVPLPGSQHDGSSVEVHVTPTFLN